MSQTAVTMKLIICFTLLFYFNSNAQNIRYDNYKVFRLTPQTNNHIHQLRQLEHGGLKVDFWKEITNINNDVDIMVPPYLQSTFYNIIKNINIPYKIMINNVQSVIDETKPRSKNNKDFDWNDYYDLNQINEWLTSLTKNYPSQVEAIIGGTSYEGRSIQGVKLSFKPGNKGIFLEGGIHAREWISPATVTYILNELLTSENPAVRDIAESYDWYIFPSVNPDGFTYTHTTDRLWRMTRQPHGECIGADPNRNWGYHWNEGGNTSNNTCDETYAGPYPFSEPEMKTLSEYIESIHQNLVGYISIHSYSQLLLIPYGYMNDHIENFDELLEIGKIAIDSLSQRYGTKFIVGNMAETIYKATGVSPDWVKGRLHVPVVYTYELRDTGEHGFLLPKEQIIPSGEELLDSLVAMWQQAKYRGY